MYYLKTYENFNYLNNNFLKWFGKSKIVDKLGNPMVLYHGTIKKFDEFSSTESLRSNSFIGSISTVKSNVFFFTTKKDIAMSYAENRREYYELPFDSRNIIDVFLSIKNPIDLTKIEIANNKLTKAGIDIGEEIGIYDDSKGVPLIDLINREELELTDLWKLFDIPDVVEKLKKAGYDGSIIKDTWDDISYVVFSPTQIKSATKNNGDFSPNQNSIFK